LKRSSLQKTSLLGIWRQCVYLCAPITLLLIVSGLSIYAQEAGATSPPIEAKAAREIYWKWANFALLVGGLWYLIQKYAPGYFNSRREQIRKGIDEAAKLKQEAEARSADMEKRMGALESELENLRREAHVYMQAEGERLRAETADHLAKIQRHAEQEVIALTNHARQELKAFGAQLAVDLAAERIRGQMTGEAQDSLVGRFVHDLEKQGSQN